MQQPTGYFKKIKSVMYLLWKDRHSEPPNGLPRHLRQIEAPPTEIPDMFDFLLKQVHYRHPGYGIFIRDGAYHLFTDN